MAVKARSDTITLVRVSDEGISHVWEGTDGLHVSTQEKPSSGNADAGRHILLTALGILLSAEGGPALGDNALQSLKTGALYLGRLLSV